MSKTEPTSNFASLEKQLAKDSLEEALKAIHVEVSRDIERNKHTFSREIQKTLETFRENLKDHISKEVDNKIAYHLEKNIQSIDSQVTTSFNKMFSPVLERTENDMKRLHIQGEQTLNSWANMMKQYDNLWNKPFFLLFSGTILTGLAVALVLSYFLIKNQKETTDRYARALHYSQESLLFYQEKEKKESANSNKNKDKRNNSNKNKKK